MVWFDILYGFVFLRITKYIMLVFVALLLYFHQSKAIVNETMLSTLNYTSLMILSTKSTPISIETTFLTLNSLTTVTTDQLLSKTVRLTSLMTYSSAKNSPSSCCQNFSDSSASYFSTTIDATSYNDFGSSTMSMAGGKGSSLFPSHYTQIVGTPSNLHILKLSAYITPSITGYRTEEVKLTDQIATSSIYLNYAYSNSIYESSIIVHISSDKTTQAISTITDNSINQNINKQRSESGGLLKTLDADVFTPSSNLKEISTMKTSHSVNTFNMFTKTSILITSMLILSASAQDSSLQQSFHSISTSETSVSDVQLSTTTLLSKETAVVELQSTSMTISSSLSASIVEAIQTITSTPTIISSFQTSSNSVLSKSTSIVISPSASSSIEIRTSSTTINPVEVVKDLVYELTFTIKDKIFTEELNNKSSNEYIDLAKNVTGTLSSVYRETNGFKEVIIKAFKNGSVIVDSDLVYDQSTTENPASLIDTLIQDPSASSFGDFVFTETCTNGTCDGEGLCIEHFNASATCTCNYGFNGTRCQNSYTIDGGYSSWSNWSECDCECGGGKSKRRRNCDNPSPINGGRDCSTYGSSEESRDCNEQLCDHRCIKSSGKGDMEFNPSGKAKIVWSAEDDLSDLDEVIIAIIAAAVGLIILAALILACYFSKRPKHYNGYAYENDRNRYKLEDAAHERYKRDVIGTRLNVVELVRIPDDQQSNGNGHVNHEFQDDENDSDDDIYKKQLKLFLKQTQGMRGEGVNGNTNKKRAAPAPPARQKSDDQISNSAHWQQDHDES